MKDLRHLSSAEEIREACEQGKNEFVAPWTRQQTGRDSSLHQCTRYFSDTAAFLTENRNSNTSSSTDVVSIYCSVAVPVPFLTDPDPDPRILS